MRRSHALILLLIVLITFALWWLKGDGKDAPASDEAAMPPATTAAAPPAALPGAASAEADSALARTDAPTPAAAADATAAPAERTLTVRVIFAADGKPAAGAEVLLLPIEAHKSLVTAEFVKYQQANHDEKLDRWGRVYACDATGVATVPMPESGWFPVGARLNNLWGRSDVREEERAALTEIEIELQAAIHVRVLVVDESRQPAPGIPVTYRALTRGRGHNNEEAITDAQGIAHLRHLQGEFYRMLGHCEENVVAISLPLEPTVQAVFDPLNPPTEPILLVMPGAGSVEVAVFDLQGRPAQGFQVALQKKMSDADRKAYGEQKGMIHQEWLGMRWMPLKDGLARFDHVGLGLLVEFGADFERTNVLETGSGPGPQRPGEVVRYTLRQSSAAPALTGRIVDEAGQPLAGVDLDTWVHPEGGDARLARLRIIPGADGRFRCPIALDPADTTPKFLFAEDHQPGLVRILVAPLRLPLEPGENDVGDLVLGGPVFAAGLVLTPDGSPGVNAYGAMRPVEERGFGARPARTVFDSIGWQAGPDGRFEIRGNLPPGKFQANVWIQAEPGWRCQPVDFVAGSGDLILQFQSPPGVRGRILVDSIQDLADLEIYLLQEGGGGGGSPDYTDGSFHLLVDSAGNYDLEVRSRELRNLLWARKDLAVAESGTIELGDLDLRDLLRTTLHVLDPDGRPLSKVNFGVPDLAGRWGAHFQAVTLPLTFLHSAEQRVAMVEVEGCARAEVTLSGGEQTVRLAPGHRVRINLQSLPAPAKGGGWGLTFTQNASGGQVFSARLDVALAAGASSAEAFLPTEGLWVVYLTHQSDPKGDRLWVSHGLGVTDAPIEVHADSGLQSFEFTVDAAAAAAAVQRP